MTSWDTYRGWLRRRRWALGAVVLMVVGYALCLPRKLFDHPYSTVLEARNGELLSASIAADGQWRFPALDTVPSRFAEALVSFEDKRFYYHPGVDPISMVRALVQNIRKGRIVSGGSTLTMQLVRLSRGSRDRTLFEKCIEIVLATRLELSYTKEELLSLYASHAPFGGNVVGLDAACWRYFGRSPEFLSWGEAALLAVLPNAPGLIHPGKNRRLLKAKRDLLLDRLRELGTIDSMTCLLSKQEIIPDNPQPLPRHSRHLLSRMKQEGLGQQRLVSTIDPNLQRRVEERLQQHHNRLAANRIFNGAVLVLDVRTGEAIAYVGNVNTHEGRGEEVDIITAPRSTGSILKPFLYAAALDDGAILPHTLLPDVPVLINGFAPENFSKEYDGAVRASDALIRSLNVPSVFMLREYRYERFYTLLKNIGMATLRRSPDHYGLSLILGGAEGTLWDITGMYASMARTLNNYFQHPGKARYIRGDFHAPVYYKREAREGLAARDETSWLSAAAIYQTFESLKEVYRPAEETGWRHFNTSRKIAWKTGTSFGFRDGWAVGVNGDFAVGVWTGNADGEGRSGLTGIHAAAPLLFDVFSILPPGRWFEMPHSELSKIATCRKSGQRLSTHCEAADTVWVGESGLRTEACRFHRTIHVSKDRQFQLHSGCADLANVDHVSWFVLPPVQEHYFRAKNISYKPLPPFRSDCHVSTNAPYMDLIYPKANARILIPRALDGTPGRAVFELAHRNLNASVFWHLDGVFVGETRGVHRLALNADEGRHTLTLVDESGQSLEEKFTVVSGL